MSDLNSIIGSDALNDQLDGTNADDQIQGLSGNDEINGGAGNDQLHGDFADLNMLADTQNSTTIEQFGASENWVSERTEDGHLQMTQTVTTQADVTHVVEFEMAVNFGGGNTNGAVQVIWNGTVIETVQAQSGAYETYRVEIQGTGVEGELTFRTVDPVPAENDLQINTDGVVWSYTTEVEIGGQTIEVEAFAPGQGNVLQVLNGTLHVFDQETGTYTAAGSQATVNVNAIGFNAEDNLVYGIATSNGVDSLGNPVESTNLIMLDAQGNSYRVGDTPYRSWTGDFDDQGNLWAFEADMDYMMVVDVDQLDVNGDPVVTRFKFPAEMVDQRVFDVAFDAETQTFRGVVRARSDGEDSSIMEIDVSQVADGGEPIFTFTPITSTIVDGEVFDGMPAITFGAAMVDGDGRFFVGGNSGNHDMDDSTGRTGGIYEVVTDTETGTATLVLVSDAPGVGTNDGAVDPRTANIFEQPESEASILIRDPSLNVVSDETADGFNDTIEGGGGNDEILGSLGEDVLVGEGLGDELFGGDGADAIFGGASPEWTANGIKSIYDEHGNRFDQFGNALPEDDDILFGGGGDDQMSGSAGHDTLDGGLGQDALQGGSGFDELFGADGDDLLFGGADRDVLYGGNGADTLNGGSGTDVLNGGSGADDLAGGAGDDVLNGDTGNDVLEGGAGADELNGGFGTDQLYSGSGNDTLNGDDGADTMEGGSGNDVLSGGEGRDRMKGGTGNDDMSGGDDRDNMNGGSGNDSMSGDAGHDYLNGARGDDFLDGGAGRDKIIMGAGNDIATGGADADIFIFKSDDLDGGNDVITDFEAGLDELDFSALNLATSGENANDWFNQNVSFDGEVALVNLGSNTNLTINMTDATTDMQAALFDSMIF